MFVHVSEIHRVMTLAKLNIGRRLYDLSHRFRQLLRPPDLGIQ